MQDFLREKTQISRDLLLHECRMNSPNSLIMDIMSRIKDNSMNPLTKAMEVDEWKTKRTFNIWENTINSLLSRLSLLHYFYIGLSSRNKMEANLTFSLANLTIFRVKSDLDSFIDKYDSGYWEDVVFKVITHALIFYKDRNNAEKADMIYQNMSGTYTNHDQFYIILYPPWEGYEFHTVGGNSDSLFLWRFRGCNIVVVRSQLTYKLSDAEYQDFTNQRHKIENLHVRSRLGVSTSPTRGFKEDYEKISELIEDEGFVGLFSNEDASNVIIRWTGSREPGIWVQIPGSFDPNSHSFWFYKEKVNVVVVYP